MYLYIITNTKTHIMKSTRLYSGEYKVERNGQIAIIRKINAGWTIFTVDQTLTTTDENNWGCVADSKKVAMQWVEEAASW